MREEGGAGVGEIRRERERVRKRTKREKEREVRGTEIERSVPQPPSGKCSVNHTTYHIMEGF